MQEPHANKLCSGQVGPRCVFEHFRGLSLFRFHGESCRSNPHLTLTVRQPSSVYDEMVILDVKLILSATF